MPKAASVKRAARRQKQRDSEAMVVDEERKRTKEVKRKKDQAEKSQAARNKKKLALKLAPGRVSYRAAMGDDAPESPHLVHPDPDTSASTRQRTNQRLLFEPDRHPDVSFGFVLSTAVRVMYDFKKPKLEFPIKRAQIDFWPIGFRSCVRGPTEIGQ